MFAAGFGDKTLQRVIFSGMESHPIDDDVSVTANATLSVWSTRSVRPAHRPILIFF